jgi:hypothetical protein
MMNSKTFAIALAAVFVFFTSSNAHAISFSGETLFGGSDLYADVDERSYDAPEFNAFAPFGSVADLSNVLMLNSFLPDVGGNQLEVTLLSEAAGYADRNAFGVVNGGSFQEVLSGSDVPGDTGIVVLDEGESKFALKSPQGVFTTDDADNADGATHIVALEVTQAGSVFIENATLSGASFTFDLLVGDLVLFMEDLLVVGNVNNINASDFDYNDMVVVVRQSEIPEPATSLLFVIGLAGMGLRRRKLAA